MSACGHRVHLGIGQPHPLRRAGSRGAVVVDEIGIIGNAFPDVPLILFSARDNMEDVIEALRRGVRGYIPMTLNPPVVIEALRLIEVGGTFVPAAALAEIVAVDGRQLASQNGCESPCLQHFTPRQAEVLDLLRKRKANKTIAHEPHMQESTVELHVRQIMRKLKATNRTQVAFIANQIDAAGDAEGDC